MSFKAILFDLAAGYCEHSGMSRARLATLIANDGKFFDRVENGGGFTIRTYERALQWFSDHWPTEKPWPTEVPRPAKAVEAA